MFRDVADDAMAQEEFVPDQVYVTKAAETNREVLWKKQLEIMGVSTKEEL